MKKKQNMKSFNSSWDFIEASVIILVAYALLDLAFSISKYIDKVIPASIFSILLMIFAFGMIGYKLRKKKLSISLTGRYGAYAGIIVGLVSAIIGFITFYFFPERIAEALIQARDAGADMALVQTMVKLGLYINIILSPAINAGLGALFAWLSFLVFKKK